MRSARARKRPARFSSTPSLDAADAVSSPLLTTAPLTASEGTRRLRSTATSASASTSSNTPVSPPVVSRRRSIQANANNPAPPSKRGRPSSSAAAAHTVSSGDLFPGTVNTVINSDTLSPRGSTDTLPSSDMTLSLFHQLSTQVTELSAEVAALRQQVASPASNPVSSVSSSGISDSHASSVTVAVSLSSANAGEDHVFATSPDADLLGDIVDPKIKSRI